MSLKPLRAGFIGLGSMGAPIARRLARCGFTVTGCDISPEMLAAFDEPGTTRCADPLETARASDLLGICVRTDAQLEALADGGRLYEALGEGGTVILHSTVAPELAVRHAELAAQYGVGFVDVGVSGGGPAAIEGALSLFVGASAPDLERARAWLDAISKACAHLGPVGRGQQAKLLNNLISIANYGMSAAIIDIGIDMGFERQQLIDAFMAGSAQSFALRVGPGFVTPGRDHMDLHDLLGKDVDHARSLPTAETAARDGLVAASEVLLARLRRAAGKVEPDPNATVDAYFAAVRAKDIDALMALYGENPTFALPNGKAFTGREAVCSVHQSVFDSGSPYPEPQARFAGPEGIAVEIEAHLPDGSVRQTTNVYRFDKTARIAQLKVYARG